MIYSVTHLTSYSYSDPVDLAHHLLHLTPLALPHQKVIQSQIVTSPPAARNVGGTDHFGNHMTILVMDEPHVDFAVQARSEVEVTAPVVPDWDSTPSTAQIRAALKSSHERSAIRASEFVHPSPFVAIGAPIASYAAVSFPQARPVLAGAVELCRRIHEDFAYMPGTTAISTPVGEVLSARRGVCQDFAHLMIAGLRAIGLSCRYVSGYIRTFSAPDRPNLRGADASHAWVSVWCGGDLWVDLDPTNNLLIAGEHIAAAVGRDFGDVSPVRGVILGGGRQSLSVQVTVAPR